VLTKAPAPQPVLTKAPAPQPVLTKAPAPQPVLTKAPAPQPVQTKAPAPQPVLTKAPAHQPALTKAPAAPRTVNVVFWIFQPQARRVSVCGEFNGWSPEANPMEPRGEGRWQAVLALKPGRYQYKFVIDGEWMADPDAKQNVYNAFGTLNSVVEAA
jgi:1,4-alpha-glucan branching enzyme